jgi:uncharacterized membrane protein
MWWIQTTGYHLAGLIWLIVVAVIFVIAVVALSTAGAAAGNARRTRRMMRDHEAYHLATGTGPARPADARRADTWPTDTRPADTRGKETGKTVAPTSVVPPPAPTAPPAVAPLHTAEETKSKTVESEQRPVDPSLGDSMRILHERYARGEITREEYLRAREDMMAMTR